MQYQLKKLVDVSLTDGSKEIIMGASNGKAVRFNEQFVRSSKRAAAGVSGIKVAEGEKLIGMCIVNAENDGIIILTDNGYGKRTSVEAFKSKGRNGKGVKFMNLTEKNGTPVCLKPATEQDDLIVITDKGMIVRTHLSQISEIGRDTQGVRIVSLYEGHTVASIAVVPRTEDSADEDTDTEFIDELNEQKELNTFEDSSSLDFEQEEKVVDEEDDDI